MNNKTSADTCIVLVQHGHVEGINRRAFAGGLICR
jgi:hypothetical protein